MAGIRLTAAQHRRFRAALREAKDTGHYRRLLAIRELDRGRSAAEMADLLEVTRQSVYNWLDRGSGAMASD